MSIKDENFENSLNKAITRGVVQQKFLNSELGDKSIGLFNSVGNWFINIIIAIVIIMIIFTLFDTPEAKKKREELRNKQNIEQAIDQ